MSSTKETVLRVFQNVQKGTEYVLMAIPMDKLDHQLDSNSAKLKDIAFHIATLPLGAAIFAKGAFEEFPSVPELLKSFKEHIGDIVDTNDYTEIFKHSCDVFLGHFNAFTDKEFIESTYENFLTRGPKTHLEGFLGTQNHILQHRGTLFGFLRSLGIKVNMRQYFGMKPMDE